MSTHDMWTACTVAVLVLIATGAAKWVFGIFDAIVPVSKAPDKLRTVFSVKSNRSLFWTSLLYLVVICNTVIFAFDKSPVTRLSILQGAMDVSLLFGLFPIFMWELLSVLRERKTAKAAEGSASSR